MSPNGAQSRRTGAHIVAQRLGFPEGYQPTLYFPGSAGAFGRAALEIDSDACETDALHTSGLRLAFNFTAIAIYTWDALRLLSQVKGQYGKKQLRAGGIEIELCGSIFVSPEYVEILHTIGELERQRRHIHVLVREPAAAAIEQSNLTLQVCRTLDDAAGSLLGADSDEYIAKWARAAEAIGLLAITLNDLKDDLSEEQQFPRADDGHDEKWQPVSPEDVKVLSALHNSPTRLKQAELRAHTKLGERVIRDSVKALEARGWISRPAGKNKGYALTAEGRTASSFVRGPAPGK